MRRLLPFLFASAVMAGCQSYKAGAPPPVAESIWVAPAVNASLLPQVESVVTERLRDAFMSDALVRLVRQDVADARLEVTISDFGREGRAQGVPVLQQDDAGNLDVQEDTGMYRAFDLVLRADVRLVDSTDGTTLYEGSFTATTQTIPSPYYRGSAEEERLVLPILARDLARQIHDAIASRWETPGNA